MFTCNDSSLKWGRLDYNTNLIQRWEKPRNLNRQWNLALMSLLYDRVIEIDIEDLESHFKRSAAYKKMYGKGSHQSYEVSNRFNQAKKVKSKIEEAKMLALERKKK